MKLGTLKLGSPNLTLGWPLDLNLKIDFYRRWYGRREVERIPVGSKEYLIVDVTDRLSNLTTLDATLLTFDVKTDEGTFKLQDQAAINDGMKIKCLVDTTGWTPDDYYLFTTIITAVERPRLGPYRFRVE